MDVYVGRSRRTPVPHRFEQFLLEWELTPLRVTLIYLAFGLAALVFSDLLLVRYVDDPLLGQLQAAKGTAEVVATGGLVYVLTATSRRQVELTRERFHRQREELLVLHRVLRHNLRNDLNVIFGQSRALADEAESEKARKRCDVIYGTTDKIYHYTEQAERIRRVTEGNGDAFVVDLAERLPALLRRHEAVTDAVDVRLELPERGDLEVAVNRMFGEAVAEVVDNAVANNDNEAPLLEMSVADVPDRPGFLEIAVSDDGPGIPDHVPRVLAESEYDQLAHLQGLGLWFVNWVVTDSGGRLEIDEREGGGSTIRLQVPRAATTAGR